jgi:transglutaminase-like putative cysteine protease
MFSLQITLHESQMFIRYGFDIEVLFSQPTEFITLMDVHPSRAGEILSETPLQINADAQARMFVDMFGNRGRRVVAQPGAFRMRLEGLVRDSGAPDKVNLAARQHPIHELPDDVLPFLAGSRYCETDILSSFAWSKFGHINGGWKRVEAICNFVNSHLTFSYPDARPTRTASDALQERIGVCRDFTHLAVTLCRALNIPARYCNGYLGDIGVPPDPSPMDFNAWFEAYIGGRWYTFDARHNEPRIGRILIARGRDAADTAMITSFGLHVLKKFVVITEESLAPARDAVA